MVFVGNGSMKELEVKIPLGDIMSAYKGLDKDAIRDVREITGSTKNLHYDDGKLEFSLDKEGNASVYMAPKSSWIETTRKIDEIAEKNPKLADKLAKEFYKKYSLGNDSYVNQLLLNDSTYTFRAPFVAKLHASEALRKSGINGNFLVEGGFVKEPAKVDVNPFGIDPSSEPEMRRRYQTLQEQVRDSLDFENAFLGGQLQKSIEKYADVKMERKGGKLVVYGESSAEGDAYGKYGALSLMEFGKGTAVVVQDPKEALDTVKRLKSAYKKSRSECDTKKRSYFIRDMKKIEEAINSKRYLTPDQVDTVKQISKDSENVAVKAVECQIAKYLDKMNLKEKKVVGMFSKTYLPIGDIEDASHFYKGLEDSLKASGMNGKGILGAALDNIEKGPDKIRAKKAKPIRAQGSGYNTTTMVATVGSIALLAAGAFGAYSLLNQPTHSNNPVENAARQKGLPEDVVNILAPLGENGAVEGYTGMIIDELAALGSHSSSPIILEKLKEIVSDKYVSGNEAVRFSDVDNDYIINKEDPAPTNPDISGTGSSDYVLKYFYHVDPTNKTAVNELLKNIPNVEVYPLESLQGGTPFTLQKVIDTAIRDPVVNYYAPKTSIVWTDSNNGKLIVDGENVFAKYDYGHQPGYYLTKGGRIGLCSDSAAVNTALLTLCGYDAKLVQLERRGTAQHVISEVTINGKEFIVDYNIVSPKEEYYKTSGQVPESIFVPK